MSEVQAWIVAAALLIQTVGFCAVVGTLGALQRRVHATQFEVTRLARAAHGTASGASTIGEAGDSK